MEAVPRLPMISFELKTSPEKANFQAKLKDYIRYSYNEDPESFTTPILQIEGLRAGAVRPPQEVGGCDVMKRYYCQLHFLLTRFPLGKDGEAAVKYTWKDPYTDCLVSAADVVLEMASVLYNIGALHSKLGAAENRTSEEGMKMACSHFQCAAWAFQHIRDEFPLFLNYDSSSDLLLFMNQVCLAQAQECLLEKSMMDNRKPSIVAKVAIQTVEYYKTSLKLLSANSSDDTTISENISSKICKKWAKYLKFKISYHGSIDMLYRGQQAEEEQKMGERVAYYQIALEKLEEAGKLSKGLDSIEAVNEALQFTHDVVEGKKKAATNENEFIYHEEVPAANLLPEMKGASLVKGIGFNVNDYEVSGPDIFGRLIPLTAHETSSIYSEELAKLLRKTTSTILRKEEELDSFLPSLQLDELKAREEWKMPQDLIDQCAAISAKQDAIEKLIESMNSLSETYQDVEGMLTEIKTLLKKEEEAVLDYEEVVGKQPPSIAATDLTREANKYYDAHAKASESNQTLHKAMSLHIKNLRLLSLPPRELREQIPIIAFDSPEDEATMKEMQNLMNKVEEMRTQRGMLIAKFREGINQDDITHLVVTFTGENKEQLFQQEMQKHQKQINLIKQNLAAQDKILGAIREVYPKYSQARRNVGGKLHHRDAMISSLKASYDAYEDLLAKSNKGLEFYSKLQTNVSKLYQRVKSTCKVLEEEREQILKKILQDVPKGAGSRFKPTNPGNTAASVELKHNEAFSHDTSPPDFRSLPTTRPSNPSGGLKLKDYLNMKKETGKMSLVSGPAVGAYSGAGYVPAPSPQLYENSAVPSWVPPIRPAPLGSEETNTPPPHVVDSDYSASWNPHINSWGSSDPKANPSYSYAAPPNNNEAPQVAEGTNYSRGYSFPTNPGYSYQAQSYPSYSQPNTYTPPQYGVGVGYSVQQGNVPGTAATVIPSHSMATGGHVPLQNPTQSYTSQHANFAPQNVPTSIDQNAMQSYAAPHAVSYSSQVAAAPSNDQSSVYQSSMAYYPGYTNPAPTTYTSGTAYPTSSHLSAYTGQNPNAVPASTVHPSAQNTSYSGASTMPPEIQSAAALYNNMTYDQQSSDGSFQNQRSSNTSLNSLGSVSSLKSQTSLTTAYSDPFVNDAAMKSQATTEVFTPSNVGQQNNGMYGYNNSSTMAYYPAGAYSAVGAISDSATGVYPGGYAPSNVYQQNNSLNNELKASSSVSGGTSYQTAYPSAVDGVSASSQMSVPTAVTSYHQSYASNQVVPESNAGGFQPQYVPQMGGRYHQSAEYLQSGNSSTYTNTLQNSSFAVTPSGSYSTVPNTLDLKEVHYNAVGSSNPHDSFIPQGAGNTPIQSPATYQQAGMASYSTGTNTTSCTGDVKASPMANSSNVDLLAGLDFDVQQTPLIPENPIQRMDTPKKEDTAVEPGFQAEVLVNDEISVKREVEEKKMDTEALEAFVPDVDKFEKFVEGLSVKTLNGPTPLEVKWKETMDLQEKDIHGRSISVARCYPMKNRYPDILPYDDSRIELPSTKDDYINASLLKPLTRGMPPLILTQAPLPATYGDFWMMVLEKQVEVVVCLLGDMELGNDIYWPTDKGRDMELGRLRLSLQTCNVRQQCVERIVTVMATDTKVSRVVVILQFTAWPGSSFPPSPAPFLAFVAEARTYFTQQRNTSHPPVVHCSSGVGRTGLFCLILAAIIDIAAGRGIPDLVTYTANISRVRKNSLRDREHLRFAYQSVLYFCQDLLLKRGILTNRTTFEEKKKKEGKAHTRHPSEDFLVLSNNEQIDSKLRQVYIDSKGKEVGHCGSSVTSSKASSGRTSPVQPLLAAMDPNAFNLKDSTSKVKQKFTPDNFIKTTTSLSSTGTEDDPLSSLDPLWSLKK